ncbi:MAG: hypothetical protein K9N47_12085 [Prosthecobacter sp.]|uniref:hypothetical protein n=1 Tax=Prosthecobacter sp. TaxID=1965333 RepID=UPI0025FA3F1D|nr:hypothetical protein [Prosthecobacter sp.]MCF7786856.1 hypothetical protein [Prosthecobacter sp.]
MNAADTPHPAELCLQRTLERTEDFVRREPTKAVGAALGAGLALTLLPTRSMVKPLAIVGAAMLPPILVGLGLIKAFELCFQNTPLKAVTTTDSP